MALSTFTVACFVLHACCIVANGNDGEGGDPPIQNKDRCSDCCDKIVVMAALLEGVVSRLEEQARDLDDVKSEVSRSIPFHLEKQTLAIEELKAVLPRGANNSQLEKHGITLEELKEAVVGIALQLEKQVEFQERQSAALEDATSQLREQDRDLEEVKEAVAGVLIESRKLAEDLTVHDYRLVEHEQAEKGHREQTEAAHHA